MGAGGSIGQALVESPKVNAISFTGSVPVGKGIAAAAVQNLTKVQMEMGSKNALAVMEDADLDLAVSLALGGAYGIWRLLDAPDRALILQTLGDLRKRKKNVA